MDYYVGLILGYSITSLINNNSFLPHILHFDSPFEKTRSLNNILSENYISQIDSNSEIDITKIKIYYLK